MFNFSNKENTTKAGAEIPEWAAQCTENQERIFIFLDKLEIKMQELCEAAIPELLAVFKTDNDMKRGFYLLQSGIEGQLTNIRKKATDVFNEKVLELYDELNISIMSPHHDIIYQFRQQCSKRYNQQFNDAYQYWHNKIQDTAKETDLEEQYQQIITEYESIKDKFKCKQCGGALSIHKIFFISTYITCPQCQTQNTFEPSTQAKNLEHLGKKLAEQRTEHLLLAYQIANQKERDLWQQKHEMRLKGINYGNKKAEAENKILLDNLELQRLQAINDAPPFYEIYLRAMFNEWNILVPDLAEQNDKFYLRQLEDFRKSNNYKTSINNQNK